MRSILVPILFAMALAIPASAADCVPSTSHADLTIADQFYVDDAISCSDYSLEACQVRVCDWIIGGSTCYFESAGYWTWVYEETNGIPGLQRADAVVDDTCGGAIPSDTLLY